MAVYFFHLCDGRNTLIDPEGRELDNGAIAESALREARWMISQEALDGVINFNQSIEVRNAAGGMVHKLDFSDAVTVNG